MRIGRLTWAGLAVAGLGWLLLAAAAAPSLFGFDPAGGTAAVAPTAPSTAIAQTTVLSGFALALLGALYDGFGALNAFFEAVLRRSAERVHTPAPPAEIASEAVVERGWVKDRGYALFADGSVEVETLLGTRRFASFEEVHEFIGA